MSVFASPAAARRRACAALAVAAVLLAGACSSPVASTAAHGTVAASTSSSASPAASTSASASPTVGSSATTLPDLPYATLDPIEQLDLYLPAAGAHPAPLLIWIHGGGWRTGDKGQITGFNGPSVKAPPPGPCRTVVEVQVPDLAELLAKGYAVAAVNYRINHNPVAAAQDAKAAVRFLRANAQRFRLDPNRFAAWGDSAGGYSAIILAVTAGRHTIFDDPRLGNAGVSAVVQAVVDDFGASELPDVPGPYVAGEDPFPYIASAKPGSIPPFRIAHGDKDCVVPLQHSRDLLAALTKAGASATLTVLPGATHEDPAFMRTQWVPTLAFLDRVFHV
jgi:acetyl esterase/lipase